MSVSTHHNFATIFTLPAAILKFTKIIHCDRSGNTTWTAPEEFMKNMRKRDIETQEAKTLNEFPKAGGFSYTLCTTGTHNINVIWRKSLYSIYPSWKQQNPAHSSWAFTAISSTCTQTTSILWRHSQLSSLGKRLWCTDRRMMHQSKP